MQLPIERSNLRLIEEDWNYLLHEQIPIDYPECPTVRQPRDCLRKFGNIICELEHCVELDREFRLRPCQRRRRRFRGSPIAAAHFSHRHVTCTCTSSGHHFTYPVDQWQLKQLLDYGIMVEKIRREVLLNIDEHAEKHTRKSMGKGLGSVKDTEENVRPIF